MRDPYTILGVAKNAKPQEIKSAFRKLAKKYHPDHHQGDPKAQDKFSEISRAYEILGDKEKRAQFDRGEIDAEGKPVFQGFSGGEGFNQFRQRSNPFGGGEGFGARFDPGEIFQSWFGGRDGGFSPFGSQAKTRAKPAPIRVTLAVSLEQVVGAEKVTARLPSGKVLNIKLPSFVENGQTIRLKGQGEQQGQEKGDLLLEIQIKKHPTFSVEGENLHCDLPVSLSDAILGAKAPVKTLEGPVNVTVPAWSSSDRVLRLKGKGLPVKHGGRGDLYVHIRVMLSEKTDKDVEVLLKQRNLSNEGN